MSKTELIKIYVLSIVDSGVVWNQKILKYEPTEKEIEQFFKGFVEDGGSSYIDGVVVHSFYVPEARYTHLKESKERIYPLW